MSCSGRRRYSRTLTPNLREKRFVSQIQGRTYANIFGLVERFINAKVLELSRDHVPGAVGTDTGGSNPAATAALAPLDEPPGR